MNFLTEHLLRQGLISDVDFNFIKIAHNVEEAVEEILLFYRNYHSPDGSARSLSTEFLMH